MSNVNKTRFSPMGKYRLNVVDHEFKMSHWVSTPTITDTETQEVVLDLKNSNWHLESERWLTEDHVSLDLRRYPGDHTPSIFRIELDCRSKAMTYAGESIAGTVALDALEKLYQQAKSS